MYKDRCQTFTLLTSIPCPNFSSNSGDSKSNRQHPLPLTTMMEDMVVLIHVIISWYLVRRFLPPIKISTKNGEYFYSLVHLLLKKVFVTR